MKNKEILMKQLTALLLVTFATLSINAQLVSVSGKIRIQICQKTRINTRHIK